MGIRFRIMKKIIFILLFIFAFLERTVFDLGPNFELVTTALILSSFYLGKKNSLWLILAILVFSDLVIGNTSIFLFTWSGFLIPIAFINSIFKKFGSKKIKKYIVGTTLGIGTNVFFFFWTNFGVWALDSWGMYSNDLQGLLMSYINGLPFLKYQLISTIILVPAGFAIVEFLQLTVKAINSKLALKLLS